MADELPDDELVTVVVGDGPDQAQAEQTDAPAPEAISWPVDDICAAAIGVARDALLEEADASVVGEHLAVVAEAPMAVTHYFAGSVPGYQGWRWSVTVSRAPDSDHVGVDETALLPDGNALLAPAWVPWKQRIESGDLGPGDLMVTESDDPRLVPGMTSNDVLELSDDLLPEQWTLGLGRSRILSPEGRRQAAQRWYREVGPKASAARSADLQCASCGFLMMIGGSMGQAFGVCANGYAAFDGRVVALNFGCGAHSETREVPPVPVAQTVIDEIAFDDLGDMTLPAEDGATPDEPADGEAVTQDADSEQTLEDSDGAPTSDTEPAVREPAIDEVEPTPSDEHESADAPADSRHELGEGAIHEPKEDT